MLINPYGIGVHFRRTILKGALLFWKFGKLHAIGTCNRVNYLFLGIMICLLVNSRLIRRWIFQH